MNRLTQNYKADIQKRVVLIGQEMSLTGSSVCAVWDGSKSGIVGSNPSLDPFRAALPFIGRSPAMGRPPVQGVPLSIF
jgi:hypothetical protein